MKPSTPSLEYVDDVREVRYELTPAQVEALEESLRKLNFTPEELAEFEERQRRAQAAFERMAAASMEEQERIGAQLWAEQVERPRAARRIGQARKVAPAATRPTRPERAARIGRKVAVRTTTPSRGDPDDADPHLPRELPGRAAELAAELQAASDALLASWGSERIVRATHEQLSLEEGT